ncbi:MAG: Rrf2 family transcriptional regulator [Bacillota bacterium]|nr:Rrf2 family transcriptional regulator [Bacillota bacterium]
MRISAKGRYGLAAMINMAQNSKKDEPVTIISISEKLGISKIYLEQVFVFLKKANLLASTKGSSGGYRLKKPAEEITAYDIIFAIEQVLFEKTQESVSEKADYIEKTMQSMVFEEIDRSIKKTLESITLSDLVTEAGKHSGNEDIMYYI